MVPAGRRPDHSSQKFIGKVPETMKTVGIIAEYNPFHNGHAFQLKKAREMAGADYAIVIMSGNFVQRGLPAIMEKSLRTEAALLCGADLVIELPVHYATASAEYFASGAVSLLDRLGITDALCFGSECGDIVALAELADAFLSEDELFRAALKKRLKEGCSYPQARNDALLETAPELVPLLPLLSQPNNILGLEYIKALKRRKSHIQPCTVVRMGADYHSGELNGAFSSALSIREAMAAKKELHTIKEQIPPAVHALMKRHFQKDFPVFSEDLSPLLAYKLLQEEAPDFNRYFDIDSAFSDRLKKCLPDYGDYASFCEKLKTKNRTLTGVSRGLLHILLNIYQADIDAFRQDDYVYYARILGFRKEAVPLLSAIKSKSNLPLLSKLADAEDSIPSENGRKMLRQDIQASHIYALSVSHKFHRDFRNEYRNSPVIMP